MREEYLFQRTVSTNQHLKIKIVPYFYNLMLYSDIAMVTSEGVAF
jgi:hypothetical protein